MVKIFTKSFELNIPFETKVKIVLHKNYFDTGFNILNYLKYIIIGVGFASRDVVSTLLYSVAYAGVCYVLGYGWFNSNFMRAQAEVSNRYNYLFEDLRKHLNDQKRKI